MFITPSFKKSLIVEQFQGNYDRSYELRVILYNEAEVFSLSITNPNELPMLPFDWLFTQV